MFKFMLTNTLDSGVIVNIKSKRKFTLKISQNSFTIWLDNFIFMKKIMILF
jgi:hypothetical protein